MVNNRKSKSKENYAKNKTFEFPQGYLKSMINSNVDFLMEETIKQPRVGNSAQRKHNRSNSKKKRPMKRNDVR